MLIELIGYAAGALTTVSLVPEIYTTWRKKEARDLSFYWLGALTIGNGIWAVYGFLIQALPIVVANAVSFSLCIVQIALAARYDKVKLSPFR